MMWLAMLVVLADGIVNVPPSRWQFVDVHAPLHGSIIDCTFEVVRGSRVQVMLLEREQADRFHRGRSMRPLYMSGFEDEGRFRYRFDEPGDYVLVIDNRIEGRAPTTVQLRLEMLQPRSSHVRTAPQEVRRAVVTLSLLFLGAVMAFSARQYFRQQS